MTDGGQVAGKGRRRERDNWVKLERSKKDYYLLYTHKKTIDHVERKENRG